MHPIVKQLYMIFFGRMAPMIYRDSVIGAFLIKYNKGRLSRQHEWFLMRDCITSSRDDKLIKTKTGLRLKRRAI